ncbi:LacI family DNA-binding transcriptional regulator [Chimaeribacter arupi]|uniref:LacI family DNA-binding transcriptional regulator n=1 Tax=Chimaeribacter arupi TaxID=2060066 RepID=UPI002711F0F0|nr:LacI family DNA-binding transcriptional regulator [Chimaeribacter arupi]WKZ92543.1 LacI family DNA-binding transcriptional regulator [Chimaeribacter arupi]
MANINDVSRLAQVSKATVSRVLSGSRGVRQESREAVLRAVEILGYQPNVIAQSLTSQSTGCVGVICATEHMQQGTGYLYALEGQLRRHNKHLLLRFANDPDGVAHAVRELGRGLCDAMVVIGARFTLPPLPENVLLLDCLAPPTANSIGVDHRFAAETATRYLVAQGRRNIALLNYPAGDAAENTLFGYRQALESHLIPYHRQRLLTVDEPVATALATLLRHDPGCNALLVTDDHQGREAIAALAALRRAVPQQMMVFSLDGSQTLPGAPPLPAITYSLDTLARQVVERLAGGGNSGPLRGRLITP